jgi:hypothetical protein
LTSGSGATSVGLDNGGTNPSIYAGSATPGSAPFRVTKAGAVTATSGAIGGWTLGATSLTAGSAGTTVGVDSGGTNPAFYAGSATPGSAPFRVTNAGVVTASDLTVTGGSITIGNFVLNTAGQITDDLVLSQKFIKNENGVNLISTESDGGEAYALSKAVSDGIYTGVQNGSFAAEPPTPANNINNSTNSLPYWTFTSSSGNITAKLNDDVPNLFPAAGVGIAIATSTGKKLTFNVASSTTAGSNAYVERYVAIPSSVARSYTFQPRVAWRDATAGATDVIGFIETQYFKGDATTKTGTQGNKTVVITGAAANTPTAGTVRYTYTADENNTIVAGDLIYVYESTSSSAGAYNLSGTVKAATSTAPFTFDIAGSPSGTYTSGGVARQYPGFNSLSFIENQISTGYVGYESWSNPNSTGNVPGDGAYLRIRVGVRVVTTTSATRSLDVAEVRLDRGPIQLLLTDQTSPGVYGYGGMWLSGGQLYIRANETGPGYDATTGLPHAGSTGIKNPAINLFASSGQIALNPSSTGSVVVQSKSAANGGSAAAVPLQVYGIASQTGDLQQWRGVSGSALAFVASDGVATFPGVTVTTGYVSHATQLTFSAGGVPAASVISSGLYLPPGKTLMFEGTTEDTSEIQLTAANATDDRIITLPDATGTVALTSDLTGTTFDLTGDVTVTAAALNIGSANSYVVSVDNDSHSHTSATIGVLALGTDTSGNYVATVTSANSLITVTGSGVEGGAVTLTADTTPTFSTLAVSGLAEFDGSVTLGDATGDVVKILNIFTTSVATNSFNPKMFSSTGATPGRFFQDTSSERYKTNIVYMEDSDGILDLKAVSYNDKVDYVENGEASPRQYGFLAEDLDANTNTIAFVNHDTEGRPDSVQYDRLVVPLHSAMRKLRSRIDELEARLAELETGA